MSNFYDNAINPKTGEIEQAFFIDDYFGSHKYGVGFLKAWCPVVIEEAHINDLDVYTI